jgi:spore maturation protein CgeB
VVNSTFLLMQSKQEISKFFNMKILYFFEEKNTLMDKWQRHHIFDELKKHDIVVEVFNPLDFEDLVVANQKLLKKLKESDFDLFMTPHNEDKLFIPTLKSIKALSVPTLLICFDNLVIPFKYKKVCKLFDLVWLTQIETKYLFERWGANTLFLPYAANPFLFGPGDEVEENINKVCFVGTPYGSRVNMLTSLISNDIEMDLFSNATDSTFIMESSSNIFSYVQPFLNLIRFSYGRRIILGAIKQKFFTENTLLPSSDLIEFHKPVPLDELGRVYSSYALCLSSTAARNTGVLNKPLNIINLRSFEIPMSGGLQICPYSKEIASYFEEGKEIVFYRSKSELIEKTKYYLADENEQLRKNMKKAARLRAEKDHTWFVRFKQVFDYFNLAYKKMDH